MSSSRPRILFLPCFRSERMFRGICRFAHEAQWILDSSFHFSGALPHHWQGDGILCMLPLPHRNHAITDFIKNSNTIPAVDLTLNNPSIVLPRVLQDNYTIGRLGAEHLIAKGLRRLGFVIEKVQGYFHRERLAGFSSVCKEQNIPFTIVRVSDIGNNLTNPPKSFLELIDSRNEPIGIMLASDHFSYWLNIMAESLGLNIPQQLAFIGVDNTHEICELGPISITSIDNNIERQGYEGAKLLHKIIQGANPPDEPIIIPPGHIHVRQSTDILLTRHDKVAKVLRMIEKEYQNSSITASLLSKRIPMSSRRLHDAFVKHVGHSISYALTQRRLNHALQLIQESDLKLWDIAEQSGFASPEVMSRLFRRKLDNPPSFFRKLK